MPSLKVTRWAPPYLRNKFLTSQPDDIEELCELIMRSDGEYSSLALANRIHHAFEGFDSAEKLQFFSMLEEKFDLDVDVLDQTLRAYKANPGKSSLAQLADAAETKRRELFRRLNQVEDGTQKLVKMREALLHLAKHHSQISKIDIDFRSLFESWFNYGFLVLQPIDWTTPAHILEKIIVYEAVHEIGSWRELRARLEPPDRFCFAFFHPAMPDEPLVFVEVALTLGMPESIDNLLDINRQHNDVEAADSAIFYSISNCHNGLAGVSFGNFLIKRVATYLEKQFPQLKKFATISPAPKFTHWLTTLSKTDVDAQLLLSNAEHDAAHRNSQAFEQSLLSYALRYYFFEKNDSGLPYDPVARFHLKNGAKLERLNLFANRSKAGINQSLGLMVNYVYDLGQVEQNHENYIQSKNVTADSRLARLAEQLKEPD